MRVRVRVRVRVSFRVRARVSHLSLIFQTAAEDKQAKYEVHVAYVQIYLDGLSDLLNPDGVVEPREHPNPNPVPNPNPNPNPNPSPNPSPDPSPNPSPRARNVPTPSCPCDQSLKSSRRAWPWAAW